MSTVIHIDNFPDTNSYGVPVSKMPNCPNCGEDELGLLEKDRALCYRCNCVVIKAVSKLHILDVPAICNDCTWQGRVGACEPADDGDLLCPQCLNVIVVRLSPGLVT